MATNPFDSFHATYRWLERPYVARRVVAVLVLVHSCLLAYSGYVHSPTLNEPAHLVAGLSDWKFGRFDVYNVNPPLVRMIAALPVIAIGYEEDWTAFYEGPGARAEMALGETFVKANGERSFILITLARWVCIPLSWIGLVVSYLWARDLYCRPAGVLASTIWCFEPNVIAHASIMTPDAFAAALGLAACYAFWRWLKKPTWMQAALAGALLGLAELTKTTLILFYLLWPAMWSVYRWPDRRTLAIREWFSQAGMVLFQLMLGLYVLNLGYGFEGSLTKLKDFNFVSDLGSGAHATSYSDVRNPEAQVTANRSASDACSPDNRFAGSRFGELSVPLPKNYVLGMDIQQRDFEHYGSPSYLRGTWREGGWWYYYLYACAIKIPTAIWAMGLLVLAKRFGARFLFQRSRFEPWRPACRDELMLFLPGVLIFAIASCETGFSEHMRYILPALPYFFIAVSQSAQMFRSDSQGHRDHVIASAPHLPDRAKSILRARRSTLVTAQVTAVLIAWFVASSLYIYPHSLSYFNETIGGPLNGAQHLLSSNLDWGQDLLYVRKWCQRNQDSRGIHLTYFGPLDPNDVNITCLCSGPMKLASIEQGNSLKAELVAISATLLYGTSAIIQKGRGTSYRLSPQEIDKYRKRIPKRLFGYSICCFDP